MPIHNLLNWLKTNKGLHSRWRLSFARVLLYQVTPKNRRKGHRCSPCPSSRNPLLRGEFGRALGSGGALEFGLVDRSGLESLLYIQIQISFLMIDLLVNSTIHIQPDYTRPNTTNWLELNQKAVSREIFLPPTNIDTEELQLTVNRDQL